MGSDWKIYKVDEFAEVIGGGTPRTKIDNYWNGEVPWITPKDLSDHNSRYISHGERFITNEGLENSSAKMVPAGTVLLSSRAPVGYLAIAKNPLSTNQGFRSLVAKDGFSPEFVYYLLKNNVEYLQRNASGTTFQELSGGTLKTLEFQLPDFDTQCQIAHILGTLDDKIEINQRMNQTLEDIARAVFKSWFVDFDPVRAKMAGKPYPLPDEIMAFFPDELVDSELGMIPKGWEVGKLGNEFKVVMGQSPPGSSYNEQGEGIAFYQGRTDFGFRYPSKRVFCTEPKRFAEEGDTLVSVRAPVGDINLAEEKCCIGRGVAAVRHKSGSQSFSYYSMLEIQKRFRQFEAEGTVFGSIGKRDFNDLNMLYAKKEIISAYDRYFGFFDNEIRSNLLESRILIKIRDLFMEWIFN